MTKWRDTVGGGRDGGGGGVPPGLGFKELRIKDSELPYACLVSDKLLSVKPVAHDLSNLMLLLPPPLLLLPLLVPVPLPLPLPLLLLPLLLLVLPLLVPVSKE